MAISNNNLSVLPFYKNKEHWHSNQWYTFGQICPVMMKHNASIPFQFVVPSKVTVLAASIRKVKDDSPVRNLTVTSIQADEYSIILSTQQSITSLQFGEYYYSVSLSDGTTYISDIIGIIDDEQKYIKIEYWNDKNLYYSGGHIEFENGFHFILYVLSTIGKPEYEFQEEITERLGYKFIDSQISNKIYKFTFIANEALCDAIRLIRMCDYINISTALDSYNVIYFSHEVEWEDNGDVAAVSANFETDTIIQKLESINRSQIVNFYNALLSYIDEPIMFDEKVVAQYYSEFQSTGTIQGKLIRQLNEILDNDLEKIDAYIPVDTGEGEAKKAKLSSIINKFKSFLLDLFLRKDKDDETSFLLTFRKGIVVGLKGFVSGIIGGIGARIDEEGHAEVTSLVVREELIVPKITFNCIDVISGDKANTFAYGTIKNVDKDNMTAELELLSDEIGTPHVDDFLRGVFHRLNGSNATEIMSDANGFYQYAGFSTSYFTPTEILENQPGVFKFKYALQPDTTIHPENGMNFFAYGNLTDKTRQAMTYETRYYTRRLKDVNTWKIDPSKNISMQDGLLDGLAIGGFVMKGYGTFQENSYFTGANIQFTPEQEEALKGDPGESAYSVSLSEYNGVVSLGVSNRLSSGYTEITDVISADSNVISNDSNVVATSYSLKTRIQAWKGSKELFYTENYSQGGYTVSVEAHGCEYQLSDGVILITNITNFNKSYLDIKVNCEGMAEFIQTYTITFVQDGIDPAILDLENEMVNIIIDDEGNILSNFPITTKAHIYIGNEEIEIKELILKIPEGVTASASSNIITISGISKDASTNFSIGITARYDYNGITYEKTSSLNVLKVTGGLDAIIYDLLPSTTSIKIDKNGAYQSSSIYCKVKKTTGNKTEVLSILPENLVVKYGIDANIVDKQYNYSETIDVQTITSFIYFSLYLDNILIDNEKIYVVKDGTDGKPGNTGEPGSQGLNGLSIRTSEWAVGIEYRNDKDLTSDIRYLDVAMVRDLKYTSGWRAFECKKTHVSSLSITYENPEYWNEFSENVGSIFTSFLLAKNAKITFLSGNEILIQNDEGVVTCGLSGSEEGEKIRFWAGKETPDGAPCKINSLGEIYGTKGIFSGSVFTPFTHINGNILPEITTKGASGIYVVYARQQMIVMDSLDMKIKSVNGLRFSLLIRIHALEEGDTWDEDRFVLSYSKRDNDTTWPSCIVISGITAQGESLGVKKSCILDCMYIPKVLSSDKIHAVADLAILNYDASYMSYTNWDNSAFSVTPPDTDIVEI